MSSGRRSSSSSRHSNGNIRISDDEILQLVSRLNQFLPRSRNARRPSTSKGSASKVLEETCEYIRNLQREVDDLSGRLSELLSTIDSNSPQAAIIRALI